MAVRKRKGSPFYSYDFTVGSRRYRGSTGQKTREAALKAEAEIRLEAERRQTAQGGWRLRHLTGTYFAHVIRGKSTERMFGFYIERILEILGKDKRVIDLTNADIARYVATRRGQVSDATVNRELTALRAMLNYAANSWDQAIPPINWRSHWRDEPPPRDRFLTRDEYAKLLEVAHPDLRPIIIFAVGTGLRRENILRLDWSDVDLNAQIARVKVKGNKRHVVELRGETLAVLTSMPHRTGRVFSVEGFRYRWDRAVKEAGLRDFRFHDLRHTFASWALLGGASLVAIRDALGHSDISVTAKYAHIRRGHGQSAFDMVAAQNTAQHSVKALKIKD